MKELSALILPGDIKYSQDHEWIRVEGDTFVIGISDYAQDQLGDIVYVEMPPAGTTLAQGDEFGTVESVKAVSELFLPVGGEVLKINADLEETPELVNQDPYAKGWMIEVKPEDPSVIDGLMDKGAYLEMLKGL